jgi:imidazolonepropionase-like amidohydrolase
MELRELAIRREVEPAAAILQAMWITTARLCRLEGRVGVVAPGAFGDVIVSRIDPLDDLAAFSDGARSISHVIQGGHVVVDR